ncbi:16S rRNA (guanine(527)-N(7))-methyltransferase RsmG [Carboxydothermus pertinax]|uniref:Ribosomal RNA small subunit methyltransferase G n=1 Tax=Carboxydothermus pertinax TaxID=870242 RepID=A0A1L8CT35_9THEO|nr:16S rRNA (guanine(527)-N(7))-methyltransferase RsmG [Carboxydothermus pertinax]GAV22088.1 16S rRNA methyltransferase G [Carboxydothermus pertinax]
MKTLIKRYFNEYGFNPDNQTIDLFIKYADLLFEENKRVNLTALSGEKEIVVKHFLDSIIILKYRDLNGKKAIDLGTGAGFPGIPLKIMSPQMEITLVDSLKKRCLFLEKTIKELGFQSVMVKNERAENLGQNKDYRGSYDYSFSRAVANTRILLELHAPLLKVGGEMFLLKGPAIDEEIADAQNAARELGVELVDILRYELPEDYGQRTVAIYQKTLETPAKYPRRPGIPEKRPL